MAVGYAALVAGAAHAACGNILPGSVSRAAQPRGVTADELVRLRDFGPADNSTAMGKPLFALSPDGTQIAFQLRRGDPSSNSYCLAMVVLPSRGDGHPILVDQGGDLIRARFDIRGRAETESGIPLVITPQWSPNGQWFAFLKRTDGVVQVWRADAAGRGSAPLTHSAVDVEGFRISDNGRTLRFVSRPGLAAAEAAIDREGLTGYHYDDRFAPISSHRPFPDAAAMPEQDFAMDIATREVHAATAFERNQENGVPAGVPSSATDFAVAADGGARAWIASSGGSRFPPADRLFVRTGQAAVEPCPASACSGTFAGLWWSRDGRRLRFLRFEGWALDRMAIYEWRPGAQRARRLYATSDLLLSCAPADDDLICAREQPDRPRHIVRIDLREGRIATLFDPNPEFSTLQLGRSERLEWASDAGHETFGELIYPVGYKPTARVPLLVVQYNARGFLRGGTGAEFPVQAFANQGFAVLNVNRPRERAIPGATSWIAVDRANLKGFVERRDILAGIESTVHRLAHRGIIDPTRVGITGLSDGSSTVQFAAIHSSLFAAGAASGCCWERTQGALVGPVFDQVYSEVGWPPLSKPAPAFWSDISLASNGAALRFPLLLQEADDEYLLSLESVAALRQVGAPVDLYVFPGEYHFKWQPAHLLASYQRSLAWFEFWLMGRASCRICSPSELQRWSALRPTPAPRLAPSVP